MTTPVATNPETSTVTPKKRTEKTFLMHETCSECDPAQIACGFCSNGKFIDGKTKQCFTKQCFKPGKSTYEKPKTGKR